MAPAPFSFTATNLLSRTIFDLLLQPPVFIKQSSRCSQLPHVLCCNIAQPLVIELGPHAELNFPTTTLCYEWQIVLGCITYTIKYIDYSVYVVMKLSSHACHEVSFIEEYSKNLIAT